jgi:RNA polymerase sigma factor (sigma-70 family)
MSVETDASLIARSWAEPACFEVIFDRHAAGVGRYLRARVDASLAEELTAETFTRAFRARRQFDDSCISALPWLYGIAANLMRMHWRSEQRRLRAYSRAAERDVQRCSSDEIDARIDAGALAPVLAEALAGLSAAHREILLLSALAELSPAEIGVALQLPGPTVRKRLHTARMHVARRLELSSQGVGGDDAAAQKARTPR